MTEQDLRLISQGGEFLLLFGGLVLGLHLGERLGLIRRLASPLTSLVASTLCIGAGFPLLFLAIGLPASPSPIPGVLISLAGGCLAGSAERPRDLVERWRRKPAEDTEPLSAG